MLPRTAHTGLQDDDIKWKHFPRFWSFMRGIHWSPVNSPHKGQWRGALMLSSICAWINRWVNSREAGDLRRHCAHYDVIVMRRYIHNMSKYLQASNMFLRLFCFSGFILLPTVFLMTEHSRIYSINYKNKHIYPVKFVVQSVKNTPRS